MGTNTSRNCECPGNEWECCENPTPYGPRSTRCWWSGSAAGYPTCEEKISAHYDTSIMCSEALHAYADCGLDIPHACGYGLACVAQTITYSQCRPLCGETAPKSFYTSVLAAGCSNDGQAGTRNTDAPFDVFVGATTEVGGVSYPACADGVNMVFLSDTGPAPFQDSHILGLNTTTAAPGEYGSDEHDGNDGTPWEDKHGRWPWPTQAVPAP